MLNFNHLPRSAAREALRAGRVKTIATLTTASASVHAVHHASDTLNLARQAVKALIAHAREQLENG